ncbi:MAG TPA: molybdopterin converting factor subunit 1 [Thermoanaerobaculia bacterium]|nr:molybdopterin converting factor subunit 1 [Thermoanaerobaculia bacterium]
MRIRLLYFASFREAVGRDEEAREIAEGTRVDALWAALGREAPALARFLKPPPAAVNREYVPPDTVLRDGDEVAFLPPVAGG